MKDAPNKLYCPINTQYEWCLRVNVYKEFIDTVHNFLQFEKVEWNKLVQAEMKARKYVLEISEQFRRGKLNSLVPNVNVKTLYFHFAIF